MFPPLSFLVLLFGLLLRFPLGVFPLPFPALKKRLYLREQDTGQSLHIVIGCFRRLVNSFVNTIPLFDDYILIAFNCKAVNQALTVLMFEIRIQHRS